MGFGICLSFIPVVGCVGQWFVKYRALAVGLAVAGSGIGNVAYPPLANTLIKQYGWRDAFRILTCTLVVVFTAALVLKPRLKLGGKSSKANIRELSKVIFY